MFSAAFLICLLEGGLACAGAIICLAREFLASMVSLVLAHTCMVCRACTGTRQDGLALLLSGPCGGPHFRSPRSHTCVGPSPSQLSPDQRAREGWYRLPQLESNQGQVLVGPRGERWQTYSHTAHTNRHTLICTQNTHFLLFPVCQHPTPISQLTQIMVT